MDNIMNVTITKKEIEAGYLSHISAVAGVKEYEYTVGPAKGVRVLEVYTGSGFRFLVLPDRGMDISETSYKGIPISWVGKQGVYSPCFFQNGDLEFYSIFFGGLLTTCGLLQAGKPCVDESAIFGKEKFGLHGRINAIPAESYSYDCFFDDNDEYIIRIKGIVRQARLYGENLVLQRVIQTKLNSCEINIEDTVLNDGFNPTEWMMLYHLNFGYPIVSEYSHLSTNYTEVQPINDFAKAKKGVYATYHPPVPNYLNDNYRLLTPDSDEINISLINEHANIGVQIRYSNLELPFCTEWINLAAQDYVVGIEPGNCLPEGRVNARNNQRLAIIGPGEKKIFHLTVGVI